MNERTEEMVTLYNEGKSMRQVAAEVGYSPQRVQQLISPFVEARTAARRSELRIARLRAAHENIVAGGATREEEAARLGYKNGNELRDAIRSIGLSLKITSDPQHGTLYRYSRLKCRCEKCRQAAKDEQQKRIKRGPKKHGLASSYKNYGCRCPRCRRANRLYEKARKDARRKAKGAQNERAK